MHFSGWHLEMKELNTGGRGRRKLPSWAVGHPSCNLGPPVSSQTLLRLGVPRCAAECSEKGPSSLLILRAELWRARSLGRVL